MGQDNVRRRNTAPHIDDWLDWSRRSADTVPRALVEHCVLTPEVLTPIQVTHDAPQQHHDDALKEFYRHFPHANEAVFVTSESFEELVGMRLERLFV